MKPDSNANMALVVDEDPESLGKMSALLKACGLTPLEAGSVSQALDRTEQGFFELALVSWRLAGADELILHLSDVFPDTLILAHARNPSLEDAVEAMRLGGFDFMEAPISDNDLSLALDRALSYRQMEKERGERRLSLTRRYDVKNIVGRSRPMQEVFRLIHKVADTDATVLILGESGTGKELVARAIHYESIRNKGPLVPVNCGAIPEELLESELFGHEKGAFTGAIKTRPGRFELAEGGTVFLDEIGDMSPMLQVKLLRVLQEHQFERIGGIKTIDADIRVIAATHQDLKTRVKEGRFREDLYYRLNVVPIQVPPLRERRSDISLLCDHFLERLSGQKGLGKKKLDPKVRECLLRYDWPGNVRELENLLERMAILADGDTLLPSDLPGQIARAAALPLETEGDIPPQGVLHTVEVPEEGMDFNAAVDNFERALITQALDRAGGVKNRAANLLKLNRTTLVEKIKKKGLMQTGRSGNA